MPAKSIRAPNGPVLIVAGTALLLFAVLGTRAAVLNANHYPVPMVVLAGGAIKNAILGMALLFVGVRPSRFAGVTAVIVATFITFGFALEFVGWLVFGAPARVSWGTATYVMIAAGILWRSVLPWSWSANKPALLWAGLTFGTLTLLFGTVILLARLS